MLLGIPEEDQEAIRDQVDANLRTEAGQPMQTPALEVFSGEMFADYIDWRAEHPSDDLMTEMLQAEFEDEHGVVRRLTRDEILIYVTVIAGAGNETTTRLIGWAGKVLAEHPDQRRELVDDRSLIPNAIEELLRYEPPAPHVGRYVARDVELHGQTVPEGNVMLFLVGSANRDDRRYPDPDRFDIHRNDRPAPHVRLRRALLPRRRVGAPRRTRRARRGAAALPGMGRRLEPRQARADFHRARLGDPSRAHAMTTNHGLEKTVSSSDFDEIDFFRATALYQDPYPYYEYVRAHGPVWREPHRGVVMVTGFEEVMSVYNDPEVFSSCNTVSGPYTKFPVPLDGRRHQRDHRGVPRHAAVQRPVAVVRSAEAHRATRALDAADHAEAAQGERGVHVAARRSPDRRVHRREVSASSSATTRIRSRCS